MIEPGRLDRRRAATLAAVVFACAVAPYLNALSNGFLTWDDNIVILSQPFLRSVSLENLAKLLSPFPAREEWLPVRDLTLMADFALFGEDPFWFALGNVLLHASASTALFFLLRRLGAGTLAAFLGACVFAVHAAHVESVTWLSGRKDPLSALFLFLALAAHARWREGRGGQSLAVLWLALALLSKASSFIFVLWAAAYDLLYRPELGWRRRVLSLVPYAALAAAEVALFTSAIAKDGWFEEYPKGGLAAVLRTNVVLLKDYAFHAIAPWRHQAIYEVRFVQSPWDAELALSALVLLALLAAAWRLRRRPWAALSIVLFFGSFAPYMNLVPHGIYYAERYLYLPTAFFALAAGIGAAAALERLSTRRAARLATAGAFALLLVVHVSLVASRNRVWADSEGFWRYQASQLPGSPAPLMNLGETFEGAGRDAEAARTYWRVLQRFGETPEAYFRLGRVARRQGNLDAAKALYERASRLAPGDPRALNNLAEACLVLGDADEAFAAYERLAEAHPRYLLGRASWARALEASGRIDAAMEQWEYIVRHAELLPDERLVEEARTRLEERAGPAGASRRTGR